jgi:hypothetical protein
MKQVDIFRQQFRVEVIPSWYLGQLHVGFNFSLLMAVIIYLALKVSGPSWPELLTIPGMLLAGNLAVFLFHRYPLHRNYPLIGKHTYRVHSQWHHQFFTHENGVYDSPRDFYILFFPPPVVMGFTLIFLPVLSFMLKPWVSDNVRYLMVMMGAVYFLLYEIFHYISHLPKHHWSFKIPFLKFIWQHHMDHHNPKLMHKYNFNIVFPLCDYLFGTFYRKQD